MNKTLRTSLAVLIVSSASLTLANLSDDDRWYPT